jgi:hypothetical protein
MNASCVSRGIRQVCLSPETTEAIMKVQHPAYLTAKDRLEPIPLDLARQRMHFKLG